MMESEERALSFGRDAASYHLARPPYPRWVADHVLALAPVTSAVEIGAGTGLATTVFARPGMEITAVEPDAEMARVLASRWLPGVEVVVSTFEEWSGPVAPVDLVFAAQAWHWLDRATAGRRAAGWLNPGGILALIWNIPEHRYERFEPVYAEHAPHLLEEGDPRIGFRDSEVWGEDLAAAGLQRIAMATHRWAREMTAPEVRRLYSTYSDHIRLDPPVREGLLAALETEVVRQGGTVDFEYQTRVFTGLKPV